MPSEKDEQEAMSALPRILPFPRREAAGQEGNGGSVLARPAEAGSTAGGPSPERYGDEAALLAACRRGDRRAMEQVYLRYRRRVYGLAARIGGRAIADELCQEIFVKIFANLGSFRGDSQLGTWIYRLAVNAALTRVTREHRNLDIESCPEPAAPDPPAGDPRLRGRLESALAHLPAGYRAVLVMHDVEGLSHEEIAEILGCRVGTSKSQLHKARMRMRELLGPMEA